MPDSEGIVPLPYELEMLVRKKIERREVVSKNLAKLYIATPTPVEAGEAKFDR
jgi:hypothetical protein